jgi:hypothetical protein
MWRDYHKTEYAVLNDILYTKVAYPQTAFAPPRGEGADRESYERIREYCYTKGIPARLCFVSKPALNSILEMFPESKVWTDREWSDYLYLSEDIIDLTGRRFSGQRNHINHFIREYPNWSFVRITNDNITDAVTFIEKLALRHADTSFTLIEANRKAIEVLENLELYGQLGGMLYANNAVVGLSLGETVGDTLYIHVEKADTDYHGSYPMLMNQFARVFASGAAEYINREEDDGIEGLRTSKLSYHPTALLDKYMVELQ